MSFIINIVVAFVIVFFIFIFITDTKLKMITFKVLNHKIAKGKVKIYNTIIIVIYLIIIFNSYKLLNSSKIVVSLMERKSTINVEKNSNTMKK